MLLLMLLLSVKHNDDMLVFSLSSFPRANNCECVRREKETRKVFLPDGTISPFVELFLFGAMY